MYEIVVRFRQREEVIETADSLERALTRVQVYKRQGLIAYFGPASFVLPEFNPALPTAAMARQLLKISLHLVGTGM